MDDIDLTDGKGRHRAEDVQPKGYVPAQIAAPAQRTALEYMAEGLGEIRLAAALMDGDTARGIEAEATQLQRLVKAILRGGVVMALALVAVMGAGLANPAPASAMEAPQPDPVASGITYRVTLDRPVVTLAVPFVTSRPVAGTRLHCGSLWLAGSPVGYGCSTHRAFTVRASLDAAAVPVGRSALTLVDEATDAAVTATLQARRPSRFGVGRWLPLPQGQLYVSATLYAYTPARGAWTPQQNSPVRVREWSAKRGRWVVRATLTTDSHGVFSGVVYLGGGPHIVDVDRLPGATVTGVTGTKRRFVLAPVVPIVTD